LRLLIVGVLVVSASAVRAEAEIAVLTNGMTLKLVSHRVENGQALLVLEGGGEVGLPAEELRGVVPDEVVDEALELPVGALDVDALRSLARQIAERHGVDPELVGAVVSVESGFDPAAVSPKGAQGLMQLMPSTAATLGVTDPFDPRQNLDGGVRHLRSLLASYRGDRRLALAAYNAGAGAVARHKGVPPYRETQDYVRKVLTRCRRPR
jgi:hypothetical protein